MQPPRECFPDLHDKVAGEVLRFAEAVQFLEPASSDRLDRAQPVRDRRTDELECLPWIETQALGLLEIERVHVAHPVGTRGIPRRGRRF